MATFKEIKTTKQPFGWLPTSWDSITGINFAGFGKKIGIIPNIQRTAAFWVNKGVCIDTKINGDPGTYPTTPENLFRFIEAGVLAQGDDNPGNPQTPVNNWVAHNITLLSTWLFNFVKCFLGTASLDEDYTGRGSISSIFNPDLWYQVVLAISRLWKAAGWEYYDTYAGLVYVTQVGDPNFDQSERLRPSLIDNATCLTQLQYGGILNRRSLPCWQAGTAEKPNLFGEGFHAITNGYYESAAANGNPKGRMAEFTCNMILCRNGITALGYSKDQVKQMAFFWQSSTEQSGYQLRTVRNVPGGKGAVTADVWPGYSYKWQEAYVITAHILCERLGAWDNGQAFGTDETKVPNDNGTPGNNYIVYSGSGATRADISASDYSATQAQHAHPIKPLGFDNALPEGARKFQIMCTHTGNNTWNAAPMRKTNTTTPEAWSGTGKDQILDAWQQKKVWTQLNKGTGAKANCRSLYVYSYASTWQSFDIDVDGTIFTRILAPGTGYCFSFIV